MEAWESIESNSIKIVDDAVCSMAWLHRAIDRDVASALSNERSERLAISPSFSLASIESELKMVNADDATDLTCSRFEVAQWMLSLMSRAYDKCPSEEDGPPRSAEKEYCVEINVQTFRALLQILKRELDALFGDKDGACNLNNDIFVRNIQDAAWSHNEISCPVALHWSVLRCALQVLRVNLKALCDMCRVEMTKRALSKLASSEIDRLQPDLDEDEDPEEDDDLEEDDECGEGEEYDCDDYDGYDIERQDEDELVVFGEDDETSSCGEQNRDESRNSDEEYDISTASRTNFSHDEPEV